MPGVASAGGKPGEAVAVAGCGAFGSGGRAWGGGACAEVLLRKETGGRPLLPGGAPPYFVELRE